MNNNTNDGNAVRGAEHLEDEIDLRQLVGTLISDRWLIAGIAASVFALGLIYALLATPVYESDAVIQVEKKDGTMAGLDDLSSLLGGGGAETEAEIEIIRSRSVLGAVVDQLGLDIEVEPNYFPLIGKAIAKRFDGEGNASAWLGLSSYAWGGERIAVQRLEVARELEALPLILKAGEKGSYSLYGPDDRLLGKGVAGVAMTNGQGAPAVSIYVAELVARPGTEFRVQKSRRLEVISALQEKLVVAEKGKKTGILQLRLQGEDPERIARILDTINTVYLRQNVERRSEEAQKTLAFLEEKLPSLKGELDASETRLNSYRSRLGSVDLSLETQKLLTKTSEIEQQLTLLELKHNEFASKFTPEHPALMTLVQQRATLQSQLAALNSQIKKMPADVQESIQLERDVKVSNDLYIMLLDKAQELRIVKAGTVGNVRNIDEATHPYEPIKPNKALVVGLSFALGAFLGVLTSFLKRALFKGVEDPDQLERALGLPTYASIPHSDFQQHQTEKKHHSRYRLLSAAEKNDLAVESVRSLRTALQFALMEARNNIVTITGPSPGIGKSFVASNLAFVLAEGGKRTLLIDADLRKGHLHRYFGLRGDEKGFSNLISGEASAADVVHETEHQNLSFIPRGVIPPNPSELLLTERCEKLVGTFASEFDIVVMDAPPVLAVTDAAIIGRFAGVNFVLVRHGVHHVREIDQTVKRLRQNGVKLQGFVFNDVPLVSSRYGYYGYHYQYRY